MALKVGIAGLRRGQGPGNILAHHPDAELYAIADPQAHLVEQFGDRYDVRHRCATFDDLLDAGIDAIVLATPVPLHAQQAIAALDAGLHVLSEVPAVHTLEEVDPLIDAVERSSGSYFFGENVNYFPRSVAWKRYLDEGHIGRVFYGEAEYIHDVRNLMTDADGNPTWRRGNPPIRYCTHSLGPLLMWTGDRCVSTTAMHTGVQVSPELNTISMEAALFKCESGAVFKLLIGFSLQSEPGRHWYCLYGTEGMLEAGRSADSPDRGYLAADPQGTRGPVADLVPPLERHAPEYAGMGGHGNAEWFMIDDWLRSIKEGAPPPIDIYAALDMTLPGLYAHQSAELGGQPVEIPQVRR